MRIEAAARWGMLPSQRGGNNAETITLDCCSVLCSWFCDSCCRYPLVTYNPGVQINNVKSKATSNPRWRRVVLKISGAALACTGPNNIDPKVSY